MRVYRFSQKRANARRARSKRLEQVNPIFGLVLFSGGRVAGDEARRNGTNRRSYPFLCFIDELATYRYRGLRELVEFSHQD